MNLTPQQRDAVKHPHHALVVACPGSGKTRTITAKLLRCVDDLRETPRRAACITYTNAAVHEIEDRLRTYGTMGDEDYCDVVTIHAFCQNNVLRHFHWRRPEYANGYTILPSDSDQFTEFVRVVGEKYMLSAYLREQFELFNREPSGAPITPAGIPKEAALDFWTLLQEHGFIDFCNIVYYSYRLLADDSGLALSLASRFKYILVDEFQDTSALQVEILKLVAQQKLSTFFLVGDPEQSIYSFAGARRQLMFDFAQYISADQFPLSGNFRSGPPIIRCAEALLPRIPEMFAVGEAALFSENPTHEQSHDHFTGITDYFLPLVDQLAIPFGDCAILAPTWHYLRPLGKRLREYGVPVTGPGACPYKRSHLFARLAEAICAYVEAPRPQRVRPVEKELFQLIINVTGKADFSVFTFGGRCAVFRLLRAAQDLRAMHEGALAWLQAAAVRFTQILSEEGLFPPTCADLLGQSATHIIRDMQAAGVDVVNLTLADLGMFASPETNLKLLTIHGSKGREFGAVALIALQDGIIPYYNQYSPLSADSEAEARRLLYVALTRAKRVLMLFTNLQDSRPQCRFLDSLALSSSKSGND